MLANRSGFTMIELLAVIVIMGVLASSVGLIAKDLLADQAIRSDLERVRTLDAFARRLARTGKTGDLVFDLERNTLTYEPMPRSSSDSEIQIRRAFRSDLVSVITPGYPRPRSNGIAVTKSGITPTYAAIFRDQDGDEVVLMFAGGTGYARQVEGRDDVPRLQ